jgi:alpha-amylase
MKKVIISVLLLCFTNAFAQSNKPTPVFYEIFVRSFADGDGDGIGDINGITQKLDYLKQLGIGGLWLTPFHPSPTYHKYDVMDYYAIDPEYGTIADFKNLLAQAHARNIKVVMDLVVNHTSSRHPWFINACDGKAPYANYYVWSDTAKAKGWYNNLKNPQQKYYGFFWEQMPDLNFDNPEVENEVLKIASFWLAAGVDGFRLDAAQHIYEPHEPEKNMRWWNKFHKHVKQINPDAFIIGEVWNKDSLVAAYLKDGMDACFNFDLSAAILRAVSTSTPGDFIQKLISMHALYRSYNPNYADAIFITNHDQDRYASILNNNIPQMKQAIAILFTLPGIPFLYYGEEIGMLGKFPDELRREPFLWGLQSAYNTRWEKAVHTTSATVIPLDKQMNDDKSLFSYYRLWLKLRNDYPFLSRGKLVTHTTTYDGCIAFELLDKQQQYLIIHRLAPGNLQLKLPKNATVLYAQQATKSGNKFQLSAGSVLIIEIK